VEGLREVRALRAIAVAASAGALAAALACGNDNGLPPKPKYQLEGSLYEIMGIGYDEASLEEASDTIAVRFVRKVTNTNDGGTVQENTVFKVGYRYRPGEVAQRGVPLDLALDAGFGRQQGTFSREVFNDPRKLFPLAERGSLTFDTLPDAGRPTVTGKFNVTFVNGKEPASGRTVFGSFEAKVP
jgi:hypothetical protein